MEVKLRRLADTDLPLLHRWLNEPDVVRWWEGDDVSWEAVVRDYGSSRKDRTEHWIASVAGRDIGWIQCYGTADNPDDDEVQQWWALGVHRTAAGIDYLVGEPDRRGRGLGSAMIRTFVTQVVFGLHPSWTQACASPYAENIASWRALEKAGFARIGSFRDAHGLCHVMVLDRG
jgi:aminoglycoside 6'-N-acetyltransferase